MQLPPASAKSAEESTGQNISQALFAQTVAEVAAARAGNARNYTRATGFAHGSARSQGLAVHVYGSTELNFTVICP